MAEPLPWLSLTTPSGRGPTGTGYLEIPTNDTCHMCSWSVVRPGVSRLKQENGACPDRREHQEMREQQAADRRRDVAYTMRESRQK